MSLLALLLALAGAPAAAQGGAAANAIVVENQKPGSPAAEWDLAGRSDPNLMGFATQMSVNLGETVYFKVRSLVPSYRLDVYRLGYYAGNGARRVASVTPGNPAQAQPECARAPIDCGGWAVSAAWSVPAGAVSGVYVVKLVRTDGVRSNGSHIMFVVRDDGGRSDLLFQTSDTTWQAYNQYGGASNSSLYNGALQVSYNRPLISRDTARDNSFFGPEVSLMRFLERNGFDVSYTSGVDTAARGGLILRHRVFLSVGHDEYWSGEQRASVEAARDAGVHLAFLSGNEMFWKTRWEAGFRTMVCYKQTTFGKPRDPQGFTGTWRDARYRTAADPARPENALTGTLFRVNRTHPRTLMVPESDGNLRLWRNTQAASQALCHVAALGVNTLGEEWDEEEDNGFRPAGLMRLSTTPASHAPVLSGPGTNSAGGFYNYLSGFSTHHATLYRAASGALVFAAGTINWSNGLDRNRHGGRPNKTMLQAMVNLLADMGAQPASLQRDLAAARPSTDHNPPSSRITYPAAGEALRAGSLVTITGTASDAEGRVGGVEVSVDGGRTWHPAAGRESFRFAWMTGAVGAVTLLSRAVDDSGNLETPGPGVAVEVGCQGPCTLWRDDAAPAVPWVAETQPVEVGVRWRADADGMVSGIRFYKDAKNSGPHRVSLWSAQGALLASASAAGESAKGWQRVTFSHPVAITANATYVASYATASGHARDDGAFAGRGRYRLPLRALAHGGVRGPAGAFPGGAGTAVADANYWVDVLFAPSRSVPRGLFGPGDQPQVRWRADPLPMEVGVRFQVEADGYVTGIRFYKGAGNSGTHVVNLWAPTPGATPMPAGGGGRLLASATAFGESPSGWQTVELEAPVALTAGGEYVASYHTTSGYAQDQYYFSNFEVYDPPLRALDSVYREGESGFPKLNAFSSNYWVEPVFAPAAAFAFHLWPETTPAPRPVSDATPIEMGIQFKPDVDGFITGIRFFKQSTTNDHPHTGSLWTADGRELATAEFSGETACGWQEVTLAAPVPVVAGTTYVASYHSDSGYVLDAGFFARTPNEWRGVWSPPLRGLPDAEAAGGLNGVYRLGPHGFPDTGFQSSNYWVDVVFRTAADP
jgi:hypothetical protein